MLRSARSPVRPPRRARGDAVARRRGSATLTAAVAVLVLLASGCGVRLEQPEPPPVTADASETARAAAVSDAEAIAAAATAAQADPAASAVLDRLQQVARGSTSHVEDLGGVWAGAGAEDPPGSTPDPTGTAAPPADLAVAIQAMVTGYDGARAGLADVAPATATVLASVALWRALAAHEVAATSGVIPTTPLPTGGTDTSALRLASFRDVDALVRGLDAAAYAYEVLAARDGDDARQSDWNRRASALRRTGELLASRSGASGGDSDPREAIYDVAALLDADPAAAAVALETEVASLWVTSDLPAASRTVGLDAALEALLRARTLGATGPLDAPAVVLPGLPGPAAATG